MKKICQTIAIKSLLFSAFLLFFSAKLIAQCAVAPYTSCSGLPSGSTQINPGSSFGMNSGIYYYTGGATTLNLQFFNGGTLIICGGPVTINGLNTGGDVIITSEGALITNGNVNVQNSRRIYNMGSLTINGNINVNTDGIVNSGVITVTGEIRFNGGGRMCMNNGATLSAGSVNNNQSNSISVPSGNACISYSGSFGGNNPSTNTSNLYICQQSGASNPSGSSAGSGSVISNCTNCAVPLSLDLISFDVFQNAKGIELNWTTANERNISYFIIEIAGEDGVFESLSAVESKGNENIQTNYSHQDEIQRFGVNYYRLSEVDYNGNQVALAVRTILTKNHPFIVYPNPTNAGASTKINYRPKNNNSILEFYSPVGKLVATIDMNMNSSFYEINLPKGQYIIRLTEDSKLISVEKLTVL